MNRSKQTKSSNKEASSKSKVVTKADASTKKSDTLLWLCVLVLVVGGIGANSYYHQVAGALRAAGGIVLALFLLGLALLTSQGKKALVFIKGSRTELRKVTWPTRQKTVQTTVIVIVMVVVTALLLWAVDSLFLLVISWLTGQRG